MQRRHLCWIGCLTKVNYNNLRRLPIDEKNNNIKCYVYFQSHHSACTGLNAALLLLSFWKRIISVSTT